MGTGWNSSGVEHNKSKIITDWDMGTGWNCPFKVVQILLIITDWDMGTGWNCIAQYHYRIKL